MLVFDLFEAVRPSELYHGTSFVYAEEILLGDTLEPRTSHRVKPELPVKKKEMIVRRHYDADNPVASVFGVSLTRSKTFARRWSMRGVVFVLDAEKLRMNYRMFPISFYGTSKKTDRTEHEEFVVGPINNVSRYIKSIEMNEETYYYEQKQRQPLGRYEIAQGQRGRSVFNNPKLKIISDEDWRRAH